MPSVTTARITEHNGGSAAVRPVQGKQQEVVVLDSTLMKLALQLDDFSAPSSAVLKRRKSLVTFVVV